MATAAEGERHGGMIAANLRDDGQPPIPERLSGAQSACRYDIVSRPGRGRRNGKPRTPSGGGRKLASFPVNQT